MNGFILATKSEMSQTFDEKGERIPTTFVVTTPCYVTKIQTMEKNGYVSIQLGFGTAKRMMKPDQGTLTKAGVKTPLRFLREFRIKGGTVAEENGKTVCTVGTTKITLGEEIKPVTFFQKGDMVAVSGTSKGKGFQGVVKRHAFKGGSKTHGQSDRQRAPGSIGMTTTPGRIFKGKRMAGRMGTERITVKGIKVVEVKENGLLLKGLLPGSKQGLLEIRKSN